jgi:transcriptional regulator with XRE-family HTH domain
VARRRREGPDLVDLHVGRQVRALRKEARLSLEGLAASLQVTHQQLQKYETGGNRMTVSMLFQIAGELRVPIELLLEGLPAPRAVAGLRPSERAEWQTFLMLPEARGLVTSFLALPTDLQSSVISLVTSISAAVPTRGDAGSALPVGAIGSGGM